MKVGDFRQLIRELGKKKPKFQAIPWYNRAGDLIEHFAKDDMCYAKYIDRYLTIFLSEKTGELVGVQLNGVSRIMRGFK